MAQPFQLILTIDYSPWSNYSGGAQRSTHNIAAAMAGRGHDVTVVYSKPPWETIDVPGNLPYKIKWAHLLSLSSKRAAPLRPLTALSVNRIIRQMIDRGRPTVIHSNGEEGGLIHRLRGTHDFGFISTPRHPHYPDVFFKYDKLPRGRKIYLTLTEAKYLMQASAARHADFCAPPSRWAAEMAGQAFNIATERLRPVPNGVPEEFLDYRRKPEAGNGPIVFFGRLSKTKGVDVLIEALNRIDRDRLPETWIIGRGDLKPILVEKVDRYGLTGLVDFKPWMDHHELGKTLSGTRMAVLPSREENFSLAVLSSMCVGVPTIGTRTGGTPEIIRDQQNGVLTPPGEPEALAAAIQDLLNDPGKMERVGMNGAEYVRNNLTWNHACEKFEELYEEALRRRKQ